MFLLSPRVARLHHRLSPGVPRATGPLDAEPLTEPDRGAHVRAALARLPGVDRDVLRAVSHGRASYLDVAALAGADARGARTALHGALVALQRELALTRAAPAA